MKALDAACYGAGLHPSPLQAFEFRAGWVARGGNVDVVIPGNLIDPMQGQTKRLHLQGAASTEVRATRSSS